MRWALPLVVALVAAAPAAEEEGRIMRPAETSVYPPGEVDIAATAPAGRLELDGRLVAADQPFPNVFHAKVKASAGPHTLVLAWDGGRREVHFFAGPGAPAGFQPFRQHPPGMDTPCTQCHEMSSRGRFRFRTGACFDCHQREGFAKVHTHEPAALAECGMCHNPHGSTVKAHLVYPKETACKQCHD
jgi:predicted CXXCH cytochrome family protein